MSSMLALPSQPMSPSSDFPSEISDRQARWDDEAKNADAKQAQLFHSQWSLIREQISTFSRELVYIRTELKNIKVLDRKYSSMELVLQKQEQLLAELQEEPRLRQESNDKLDAEMKDMYASLSDAMKAEAKDRSSGIREAVFLANQNKQLIEKEYQERVVREEELAKQLLRLGGAQDQERLGREQADADLHSSLSSLQQQFSAEKSEHLDEIASVKRMLQTLESTVMAKLKDLRINIEDENATRNAADSRLEKSVANVEHQIEQDKSSRTRCMEEMERQFISIKADLEQEAKTRHQETITLHNGQARLKDLMEAESSNRAKALNETEDRSQRILHDCVQVESRERKTHVQDLRKDLSLLQQTFDNEFNQRAAGHKEINDALRAETTHRNESIEKLRDSMHSLMSDIKIDFKSHQEILIKESRERVASEDTLLRMEKRLDTTLEGEISARKDANASLHNELREGLRQLSEALAQEARERAIGCEDNGRQLLTIKDVLEKEVRDRSHGDADVVAKLTDLVRVVEQQKHDRAGDHDALAKNLEKNREELANEKAARSDALAVLGLALQTLDSNTTQQLKDHLAKIELEASTRSDTINSLENNLVGLVKTLNEEIVARTKSGDEHERNLRSLQQDLEKALETETRSRGASHEDFLKHLQELKTHIQHEKATRDHADVVLHQRFDDSKDELANEARNRSQAHDTLHKEIQAMVEHVNTRIHDVHHKLDREVNTRDFEMKRYDKNHNDLRESHEGEIDKHAKWREDVDKVFRVLQAELEEEGKRRVAGHDYVRDLISAEKSERIAGDEDNMHRLTNALVKLDSGVEAFRDLMQGRLAHLSGKLDKPKDYGTPQVPAKVTTFYIGED